MSNQCELIERPAQPVASIRTHAAMRNISQVLGEAWGTIAQHLEQIGQPIMGAPFAAYYNMDMENLDLEIGFPVAKAIAGKETVQSGEIPAGKAVVCIHKGPYDKIGETYEAMNQWMKDKQVMPTGVCYEFYLNDPQQTPPEDLETRIVFPLKA